MVDETNNEMKDVMVDEMINKIRDQKNLKDGSYN